jgi:hypothetical protein
VWIVVLPELLQISLIYFTFFVIRNYFPKNIDRLILIMQAQCVFIEAKNKSVNIT